MDKYFGIRTTIGFHSAGLGMKFKNGIRMPCGHVGALTGSDQQCPNSGKCPVGHGECWAEKYDPPPA